MKSKKQWNALTVKRIIKWIKKASFNKIFFKMFCVTCVTTWSLMAFLANLPWAGGKSQVVLWPWTGSFRCQCLSLKKINFSFEHVEGILINYHFWYFNESICTGPKDVQNNESDMPSNKVYRHVQIPPAESMWLQDCKGSSWNILPALHSVLF